MTEVCRWCRLEVRRCKPVAVSREVSVPAPALAPVVSISGIVGCAEAVREDEVIPCDVVCVFLPRVTEASLDCVPFETCPSRY